MSFPISCEKRITSSRAEYDHHGDRVLSISAPHTGKNGHRIRS